MVASILRGSNELLKGEKLSTAVGRTAKTAGLAWVAGLAIHPLGAAIAKHLVPLPKLTLTDHYINQLQKVQWQSRVNGSQLYDVGGLVMPDTAARLNQLRKLLSDAIIPPQLGVEPDLDKAGKLYKMFMEYSNKVFDPKKSIAAAVKAAKADDNAKKAAFDVMSECSMDFAATMQKIGQAVTAAVQGGVAAVGAKPAGQPEPAQPAPAAQSAQPAATPAAPAASAAQSQPGTAAANGAAAPDPATAAPAAAPAAPVAPTKPAQRQPDNAPLWKQTMASFKQAGYADVTRPDVAYAMAQHYKASGGKWAAPQAAAQAPLQAAA